MPIYDKDNLMNTAKPRWLELGDELLWPLVGMSLSTLAEAHKADPDAWSIVNAAQIHFAHCIETSMRCNEEGKHSVAISLLRQCIESLTLVDMGLQNHDFAFPLLMKWKEGKKSLGELRKHLDTEIWSKYGTGLWDESWSDFLTNLASAVQPYAHYTQQLQGWQYSVVGFDYEKQEGIYYTDISGAYDALKASRITLFHELAGWTLGRLLLANGDNKNVLERASKIEEWGKALGKSKLLFKNKNWGNELLSDMFFKPGADWHDK